MSLGNMKANTSTLFGIFSLPHCNSLFKNFACHCVPQLLIQCTCSISNLEFSTAHNWILLLHFNLTLTTTSRRYVRISILLTIQELSLVLPSSSVVFEMYIYVLLIWTLCTLKGESYKIFKLSNFSKSSMTRSSQEKFNLKSAVFQSAWNVIIIKNLNTITSSKIFRTLTKQVSPLLQWLVN